MQDLVSTVHDVVGFAEGVTRAVAEGYSQYDQQIAGTFQAGGAPAAGTVYQAAAYDGPAGSATGG